MKSKKNISSRDIALQVIKAVEDSYPLQEALDSHLERYHIKENDKALTTNLVYGYFRIKNRLLFVLNTKIRGQFKKLPNKFLYPMCLAVYEILYMEKIPDYASVNWYVEYIKKRVDKRLVGLANGVLRNICRDKQIYLQMEFYRKKVKSNRDFFEIYYSMPKDVIDLFLKQYSLDKARCFLEKSIEKPYIGIRINKKLNESANLIEKIELEKKYILKYKSRIYGFEQFYDLDKLEQDGLFSKKSFESQIILEQVKSFVKPPIWDLCAGIGGKLTYFLEQDIEPIWASDIDFKRLTHLKKELVRLRLKYIPIFLADAKKTPPLKKNPNTIILDVPCTGLGVVCRRPDLKYRFNEYKLKELLTLQEELIENSIKFLPNEGTLVYITCTWNKMENEDIVNKMLSRYDYIKLIKEIKPDFCSRYREFFYCAVLKKYNK